MSNETFRQNSNDSSQKTTDPQILRQNSDPIEKTSPPKKITSPPQRIVTPKDSVSPPKVTSPPVLISKLTRGNSTIEENQNKVQKSFKPDVIVKDVPRAEKPAFATDLTEEPAEVVPDPVLVEDKADQGEENNGVGDKIKIFEKAAETAATSGRLSRPGSMRRPRTERLPSDELPPPPSSAELSLSPTAPVERQPSLTRAEFGSSRWPRNDNAEEKRPEPQKIIRPEFRPLASPAEVTIRSPSLGAKVPERFSSHGTAFRNVATTPAEESENEDHKCCKKKYSVSRGSSYFTRGSEEIWLVKKKDIEAIEERVLDSFRRSGPTTGAATLGRGRRQMYSRSESLEPASVPKAHTLKRQTSVACTCGHDKKTRARSADTAPPRPRTRSHGDDNNQAHVLDKYETLV